jgi:hypothetical protein
MQESQSNARTLINMAATRAIIPITVIAHIFKERFLRGNR